MTKQEYEATIAELRERLDIAERALLGHGYRKSCGIPACNCGDQWNHGGLARERLGEIDAATRDYYQNGETLLTRVQRVVATSERHEAFVRAVREIAERAVIRHGDGLGEASGTIAIIAALCGAELGKENSNGS